MANLYIPRFWWITLLTVPFLFAFRRRAMEIKVKLLAQTANSTISSIEAGNYKAILVEDGARKVKVKHETRIPAGRYRIIKRTYGRIFEKYRADFGQEYVLELENVPGFTDILIHIGNSISDTSGCLLPNYEYYMSYGNYYGRESTQAYKDLYEIVRKAFDQGLEVFIDIDRSEP
jgi:Family of unknown function (DUF5675)